MNFCPNLSNKKVKEEFEELVEVLGEDSAYYIWDKSKGNGLELAPNGADSKLFEDLLELNNGDRHATIIAKAKTLTNEFFNWFGDWTKEDKSNVSKVVDENGEPLIVYHGNRTEEAILEFKKDKLGSEHKERNVKGFWFITDKNLAKEEYALKPESKGRGRENLKYGEVIPVFLNIKNPVIETQRGIEKGYNPYFGYFTKSSENLNDFFLRIEDTSNTKDGYIVTIVDSDNSTDDFLSEQTQLVVKNPNQIKSATDNNGNFSTEDNNIYHHRTVSGILKKNLNKLKEDFKNSKNWLERNKLIKDFNISLHKLLDNDEINVASGYAIDRLRQTYNLEAIENFIDIESDATNDELKQLWKLLSSKFNRPFRQQYLSAQQMKDVSGNANTKCFIKSEGDGFVVYTILGRNPSYTQLAEELLHPLVRTILKNNNLTFKRFLIQSLNEAKKDKTLQIIISNISKNYKGGSQDVIDNEVVTQSLAYFMKNAELIEPKNPIYNTFKKMINFLVKVLNEIGFDWFDANHKINLKDLAYILKFENINLNIDKLDQEFNHISSTGNIDEILENSEFEDIKSQLQTNGIDDDNYAMRIAIHKSRNDYMDLQEALFIQDYIQKLVQTSNGFFNKVKSFFKSKWNKGRIKDPSQKLKIAVRDQAYKEFNETLYHENIMSIIKVLKNSSESFELKIGSYIERLYDEGNRDKINDVMRAIEIADNNIPVVFNNNSDIFKALSILNDFNVDLYENGITLFGTQDDFINALVHPEEQTLSQSQQDYVNSFIQEYEKWLKNNLKENSLNDLRTMYFQHDNSLRCPNEEAYDAIKSGLESRLISIKRGNAKVSKNVIYNIKARISLLQSMNMYDVADMYKVYYQFLDTADSELTKAINFFEKCKINNKKINAERLMYFKTDVIGYYRYIIDNYINCLSEESGLSEQQRQEIKDLLESTVKKQLSAAEDAYNSVLDDYTRNIVDNYVANNMDLGDNAAFKRMAQDALRNKIKKGSLGKVENLLGDPNSSKSVIVRIIANMLNNAERKVYRTTIKRGTVLMRKYKACESFLSKMGNPVNYMKNFVELDNTKRPTGKFIRSINYGLFEKNRKEFEDKLRKKYHLSVDEHGNTIWHWEINGTEDIYNKYQDELDDWLGENCERQYTTDYYKTRRKFITYQVRQQLNPINDQINALYDSCTRDDGNIYINDLSLNERLLLLQLLKQRLELANPYSIEYDSIGNIIKLEKKTGESLEIAEAILAWNKERAKHIISTGSDAKYKAALAKITDPQERAIFEAANLKEMISPDFYDQLQHCSTASQTEEYLKASAERGKILSSVKEDGQYIPNLLKLNDDAWIELGNLEMELELKKTKGEEGTVLFDDIAEKRPIMMVDPQNPNSTITVLEYFKRLARQLMMTDPNAMSDFYNKYYIKFTDLKGTTRLRPLNVFYYTYPKDPKYITKMPIGPYVEYNKIGWVNSAFNDNDPERILPKDKIYHNDKYDELMKDSKAKAFYDEMISMMEEAIKLLPKDTKASKFTLPLITESSTSLLTRNLAAHKFGDILRGFALNFTITENDSDFYDENRAVRPDNSVVESIPIRYVKQLDDSTQVSCDLVLTVSLFYQMAQNFSEKSKVVPLAETLVQQMSKMDTDQLHRALTELEMYGYGHMLKGLNSDPSAKMTTAEKVATKNLNSFRSIANLAMLAGNVYAATKGAISAEWQVLVGGFVGKYYSKDDLVYGYSKVLTGLFDAIRDLGSTQTHNLLQAAMRYNGAARDINEIFGDKSKSRFRRILQHFKMGIFTLGDYTSTAILTASIYHATRLIEIPGSPGEYRFVTRSQCIDIYRKAGLNKKQALKTFKKSSGNHLLNMYTLDEDGNFVLKDKVKIRINDLKKTINPKYYVNSKIEDRISGTIEQRASVVNGVISKHGKSAVYQGVFSRYLVTMRGYMISQGFDRLKGGNDFDEKYYEKGGYRSTDNNSEYRGQYNFETGEVEYGTLRSFARCFTHFRGVMRDFASILPLIKKLITNDPKSLTREDIQGIKQTIGDIVGTVGFLALALFYFIPEARKYPESWWLSFGRIVSTGCGIETSTMVNPYTPADLWTTVTTTKSYIDDASRWFGCVQSLINYEDISDDYVRSGAYKNKPKWFRDVMKISKPLGLTGYYETFTPVIPGIDNPNAGSITNEQRQRISNILSRPMNLSSQGISNIGDNLYDMFMVSTPTTYGLDSKYDYYQQHTHPATLLPKRKGDKLELVELTLNNIPQNNNAEQVSLD